MEQRENSHMYSFSIKDLEHLSGVKAHTIRMWEQRYNLLEPQRTDTNIRFYNGDDLKLLLNVSILQEFGYKISAICSMGDAEMKKIIQEKSKFDEEEKHLLNILKISMINYDETLFQSVLANYLKDHSLEQTFNSILIPFLSMVGVLWQTDSICPAQEHFISNLIRQKVYCSIDTLANETVQHERTFVLYLPENEIHDIGLLMMHYIIKAKGYRSIYLGTSVPFADILQVQQRLGDVDFVSFFTTHPSTNDALKYLSKIEEAFANTGSKFHLSGWVLKELKVQSSKVVSVYSSPQEMLDKSLSNK